MSALRYLSATAVAASVGYLGYRWTVKRRPFTVASSEGSKTFSQTLNLPSRSEQLKKLRETPEYDLLVIGGGATGSGVALDAVTRGLHTALVEKEDFSAGTSSRSTKLIHGGVRYLQKAIMNLDREQASCGCTLMNKGKTCCCNLL
jgi:glycerol-3-phosphate dehydrogenase